MKKVLPVLLTISLLVNIALVYFFFIKGDSVKINDERTAIHVSEENKDFVLAEMRGFLESVQQINKGIIENDAETVISASKKSGGTAIDHAPPSLVKSLPLAFKTLGCSTHDIFDEIAKNAEDNFEPKETQKKLDILLNNCVACHRSYKLETKLKR